MAEPRWGQLTYASFDTGVGSGGWQVKQTTGNLSSDEIEKIKARVVTLFEPAESIPQYPTPDEVDKLPRRLIYVPLEGLTPFAYWHAVPSGVDGTGRPGNVFTHVLVDRERQALHPVLRPVTLWRSGFWTSPFGQQAVISATVDDHPRIEVGTGLAPAKVVDFVLDPAVWRGATFAAFLDCLLGAIEGGPRVILATETADSAALWVAAATMLTAPQTSREIAFSLFERASGIDSALSRGALIVCIPHSDVEAALQTVSAVVIDDRVIPRLGDLGGEPHQIGDTEVAVSPWSVMAQVAFQEPSLALEVLARIDLVSEEVGGNLAPEWPLAMVVALMSDELADASAEAFHVLRDRSPSSLKGHPSLWDAVSTLAQNHLGTTTQDAWDQVAESAARDSVVRGLAVAVYEDRLLDDLEWLGGPVAVPAATGTERHSNGPVSSKLIAVLDGYANRLRGEERAGLEVLRLGDWAARSGLLADADDVGIALEGALAAVTIPVLLDRLASPRLAETVGPVEGSFLSGWLRPMIESALGPEPIGERVDPTVLAWLFPDPDELLWDENHTLSPLALESVVHRAQAADPSARPYLAAAVLHLVDADVMPDNRKYQDLFRAEWFWPAADVYAVESASSGTLPLSIVKRTLQESEWTNELNTLAALVIRTAAGEEGAELVRLARLRMISEHIRRSGVVNLSDARLVVAETHHLLRATGTATRIQGIDYPYVISAFVVAIEERRAFRPTPEFLAVLDECARSVDPETFATAASRLIADGMIERGAFPFVAAIVAKATPESPLSLPGAWRLFAAVPQTRHSGDRSFLELLADELARVQTEPWNDLIAQIQAEVDSQLSHDLDAKQATKMLSELDRFSRPLWRHFKSLVSADVSHKAGLRGLFGGSTAMEKEYL